jgi:dihydroorotase
MRFDLLIKGGQVVDPTIGPGRILDVAINRDRIAAVGRQIPVDSAFEVIDATGQLVTPGLVDLHTHVYRGVGYYGVDADTIGATSGVTTWIDAGSAGALTLSGFREFVVDTAAVRIFSLLNISYLGLIGPDYELVYLDFCDPDICEHVTNRNRDLVVGVKVRIDAAAVGSNGIEPMKRARDAADRLELPLMTHIADGPPPVERVLELKKSGDILTHCSTGANMRIVDEDGRIRPAALAARERGVFMDIGHGSGAFSFSVAEILLEAGFKPDAISSDMHQLSIRGPMYDLPTCLSKFRALGMDWDELIAAATSRPAAILGLERDVGSLQVGHYADVALFEVDNGDFRFYDSDMNQRIGRERLRNTLTIVGGRKLARPAPDLSPPWLSDEFRWPGVQADFASRINEVGDD